jgi:hypothetical protein
MIDPMDNIASALAALTTAIATLASENARARGFSSALEARIAALEAIAVNQMNNAPAGPSTTDVLRARNLTTFERATRPVRDGQW